MQLIEDDVDLSEYMTSPEANRIRPANDWMQEVIDHFHAPAGAKVNPALPWQKTENIFEFRPGEVSLIGGMNGHGKSVLWNHVMLALCQQGERVAVASLEMKPKYTLARMTRQASGEGDPPIHFIKEFGKWTNEKLWVYDRMGECKPDVILAVIRYAKAKFDIDHFVIDNLTKIIQGESGDSAMNGQKDFVNRLCMLAQDLGIHIHLIMHVRKAEDETKVPSKMDLKGSGSITDMVDNIFIVWRNKKKENSVREGNPPDVDEPDCLLILDKQRNGEGEDNEARFKLWFDRRSMQYLGDGRARPESYRVINQPMRMN